LVFDRQLLFPRVARGEVPKVDPRGIDPQAGEGPRRAQRDQESGTVDRVGVEADLTGVRLPVVSGVADLDLGRGQGEQLGGRRPEGERGRGALQDVGRGEAQRPGGGAVLDHEDDRTRLARLHLAEVDPRWIDGDLCVCGDRVTLAGGNQRGPSPKQRGKERDASGPVIGGLNGAIASLNAWSAPGGMTAAPGGFIPPKTAPDMSVRCQVGPHDSNGPAFVNRRSELTVLIRKVTQRLQSWTEKDRGI
jgi:hypothetical protein